jgi:Xaa-Pro aminopeptidase
MAIDFKVPESEITARIARIQAELRRHDLHALFIVQRVDLYYFTGTAQNAYVFIPAEGQPLLMVRKYLPRALNESCIPNIVEIKSVKEIPSLIGDFCRHNYRFLGFELDVIPVNEFNYYRQLFKDYRCVDASSLIHKVRMIKSDWEITQLERSAELSSRTFQYMRENMQAGFTEIEFAGMVETFARKLGHGGKLRVRDYQTEGYPWHILSGKSGGMVGLLDSPASGEGTSPAFPCGGGNKRLAPNEPVMIDFTFVLNGYHIDETRMFAIHAMPARAMRACQAVIELHNAVLEKAKPGVRLDELYQLSTIKADALGYGDVYLGPPGYKVSFIGHGVGLEMVEPPFIAANRKEFLQPGMVFALEPKMVFENEFSAGIESDFLVTENGCRLISQVPVEVFIC